MARAFPDGIRGLASHFQTASDRAMLAELEKRDISAMRVRERIAAFKAQHQDKAYIIVVIPLLLESGQRDLVDRILVVNADETVRIERVRARDGRSAAQIRAIIKNQADDSQRRAAANDMLDNNGSLDELQYGVEKLHQRYTALAAQDNFM